MEYLVNLIIESMFTRLCDAGNTWYTKEKTEEQKYCKISSDDKVDEIVG